jgi:hypothetical protein
VLTKEDLGSRFDRILHFEQGRLIDDRLQQAAREAAQ